MSTFTQILYQIVFGTKYRQGTLAEGNRDELYRYMAGVLKNKKCHVYRINGVKDHVHIVTHLNPTVALSDLVKDIKLSTTDLIRKTRLFPSFNGWQEGYGAFTYSIKEKDRLIEYVKNQQEHHRIKTFKEELIGLLREHGVEFGEQYLL
ncbi:MAG: IS200/IS605 family transposase [Ignavibacteriales bacterium]|nr:IS200/IS605 family transposase [Ignavibacteriales bacterium]